MHDAKVTQHTPGPWTLKDDPTFSSLGDKRIVGANLISPGIVFGGLAGEANARLIAASPDLLAVCKEAYIALPMTKHNQSIIDALRAAIAKATGGAQ